MADDTPRIVLASYDARIDKLEKALKRAEGGVDATTKRMSAATGRASKQMSSDMDRAAATFNRAFGAVKGFAGGFLGGLAAGAIAEFTSAMQGAISSVAELQAQSQQAGVGVEELQRLQAAALQAKVGTDALTDGLKEMQLRIQEFALTGGGTAADALKRLGFTADELKVKLKNPSDLFLEIIGRLQQLDRSAQILNLDDLFGGTGGEQFIRLVELGAERVRQIGDEAHATGRVMNAELVQRAADLDAKFHVIAETIRVNLVAAIVAAAGEMSRLQQMGASWSRFMAQQRGEVLSPGAMIGDLAGTRPLPVWDRRENEDRTNRARLGDYTPPPIDQSNLPPVPPRAPNLLDYDPATGRSGAPAARSGGVSRPTAAGAARTERDAVEELIKSLEEELRLVGATDQERQIANNLRSAGAEATDAQRAKIQELTVALEQQEKAQHNANRAAEEIRGLGSDAMKGLLGDLLAGRSAADAFAGALDRVVSKLADMAVDKVIGSIGLNIVGSALGAPGVGGIWAEGGWTGNGSKWQPAGLVHRDEFVFSKAAVQKAGVANLDRLHRALKHPFAEGGHVGGAVSAAMARVAPAAGSAALVVNISSPITVHGSAGTPEQNQDLAERARKEVNASLRGLVVDEISKQMRPGGMFAQPAYGR